MFNLKRITSLALFFITLLFLGCEDEIDINAPYEDIAVVYCLLDGDSSRHYVKINKLYQTEGNAELIAGDRSEQEYDIIDGYLVELNDDGTENQSVTFPLQSTDSIPKDSGLFYYPDQTVYYVDGILNKTKGYKLSFTKPNGDVVTGSTQLIRKTAVPLAGYGGYRVNGFAFVAAGGEVTSSFKFTIVPPLYAKIMEFEMTFRYTEEYANGVISEPKEVEIPIGDFTFNAVRESETDESELDIYFNPQLFYKAIGDAVPVITGNENPAIIKRQPLDSSIVIEFGFADSELSTYIEVTKPSTSLLEDKPPYTNIDNGIGVMASRTKWTGKFLLSTLSYDELATGEDLGLTGGRGFCNPRRAVNDPVGTQCY